MKILNKNKLERNIDEIALFDLKNNNIFGSSYFVYQNGEAILKKHFGENGRGECINDSTLFRLASMTKPITAVAMMILDERGLISLDDPISKYIPEFKNLHIYNEGQDMGVSKFEPNILSLLSHASGFGISTNAVLTDEDRETKGNTIKFFIDKGLKFEPFTGQEYSAYAAFDVLAAIAEKVTGAEFEDFLRKEIFIPCGMKDTTFVPDTEQWNRVVKMHNKAEDISVEGITYPNCVFDDFPSEHKLAGAGLVSSLDDYAEFAKMLLSKGKTAEGRIISEETAKKMYKPYLSEVVMPWSENWGLGVRVITKGEYKYLPIGTFGWSGAYGSHFWIDTENNICAVFMKNSRFDGGAGNKSACRFEKAVFESLD